jgi:hypothetical protein
VGLRMVMGKRAGQAAGRGDRIMKRKSIRNWFYCPFMRRWLVRQ